MSSLDSQHTFSSYLPHQSPSDALDTMPFSPPIATSAPAPATQTKQQPLKMSLDGVDEKDFTILPTVSKASSDVKPLRRPSAIMVACAVFCVLVIYAAWSIWLYYYFRTRTWPLPRGPLNATDGLLHTLTIFTKTFIVVLALASLVVPFTLYERTRRPGHSPSFWAFNAWILFAVVVAAIPLILYYTFMCFMQYQAFLTPCDASEDVTIFFVGSSHGLRGEGTTATLYSTTQPQLQLGVYTLASTGAGQAELSRSDGGDYFLVDYAINAAMNSTVAMAFTSAGGPVAYAASGDLTQMTIAPQNATLEAVGEVMEHPLNFRLIDASPRADVILRTISTNPTSCRELKLCASGWSDPAARTKFLIPMGWALYKHAAHAFSC